MSAVTHKAGELIGLSFVDEYGDYRFNGLYHCLQNIDIGELAEQYVEQAPACAWDPDRKAVNDSGFGAYMIALGLVEELLYDEINCGSYGFKVDEIRSQLHGRYERSKQEGAA